MAFANNIWVCINAVMPIVIMVFAISYISRFLFRWEKAHTMNSILKENIEDILITIFSEDEKGGWRKKRNMIE